MRIVYIIHARVLTSTTAPIATGWSDQLPGGNRTH